MNRQIKRTPINAELIAAIPEFKEEHDQVGHIVYTFKKGHKIEVKIYFNPGEDPSIAVTMLNEEKEHGFGGHLVTIEQLQANLDACEIDLNVIPDHKTPITEEIISSLEDFHKKKTIEGLKYYKYDKDDFIVKIYFDGQPKEFLEQGGAYMSLWRKGFSFEDFAGNFFSIEQLNAAFDIYGVDLHISIEK